MTISRTLIAILSLSIAACTGAAEDDPTDPDPNELLPPPGCEIDAPPVEYVYPSGPYGTGVGDTFENIALDDCDGVNLDFGDVLAQSELVLFNVGAGWCGPCIEETETLDQDVFREYCERGLRVIQVVFQDDESRPATGLFCRDWRQEFGLSFPVLYDPLFETNRYFESVEAQTPINFLVDASGEIVYKSVGTVAADLDERIEQFLP